MNKKTLKMYNSNQQLLSKGEKESSFKLISTRCQFHQHVYMNGLTVFFALLGFVHV